MELDEKLFVGTWAKSDNQPNEFLIINEAVISGLCLLGEDVEPCFEGASVQKLQFSFEEDFKNQLFSMMKEMKEILDEGGHTMNIPTENEVVVVEETTFEEAPAVEEEVVAEEEAPAAEEVVEEEAPAEEEATEFEEKEDEEEKCEECGKPLDECTCDKEDKKEYDLSEIVEYTELNSKYEQLLTDYADLQSKIEALQSETEALREFKNAADRKEKEAMIENFYMLSDEDKKEVVEKINEYTVDEIEAKLSVICVRNKVNFSLDEENTANAQETVYNLDAAETQDDCVPAWIKSVRATAENL